MHEVMLIFIREGEERTNKLDDVTKSKLLAA